MSARAHAFPWREEESLTGGFKILRPTVDVELCLADLAIKAKALIDTGSPRCVFPRGVGDLLGIEFPGLGGHKSIRLMGHTWPAVSASVTLTLPPLQDSWEAEIDFVVEEGLPFALLGYEGFFNRWAVSLNGSSGYVMVEHPDDFHARQPAEPFADLIHRWPHG